MTMKPSLILPLVGAIVALSSGTAEAVDFEFRNFEGLWESVSRESRSPATNSDPSTFKCYATGDFLKAVCETTTVLTGDALCARVNGPVGDGVNTGLNNTKVNALLTNKFSLDQFDAETGIAKDLLADLQCCGSDGCELYPWAVYQTLGYPGVPTPGSGSVGPRVIATIEQQPGKSNRHVRSLKVTIRPEGVDVKTAVPDVDNLYKVAGGFKSLD